MNTFDNITRRLKADVRALSDSEAGQRFQDYRHRHTRPEPQWQRWLWVIAACLLVVAGLLLSIPPGVPGFLIWVPALGMLAARIHAVARALDAAELTLTRVASRLRLRYIAARNRISSRAHNSAMSIPLHKNYALFLDVDGTLVDFEDDPAGVTLPESTVKLLTAIDQALGGAVALVSGRALKDLERVARHAQLRCVGMHGLEFNALCDVKQVTTRPAALTALAAACQRFADEHPGIVLEHKALGVALHYRTAPQYANDTARFAEALLQDLDGGEDFETLHGKMLVEFRPRGANKGSAVERLMHSAPFAFRVPLFIGDDVTDEAGFAAVNRRDGVSIKCGDGDSCARYRLSDIDAVHAWLSYYLAFLEEEHRGATQS